MIGRLKLGQCFGLIVVFFSLAAGLWAVPEGRLILFEEDFTQGLNSRWKDVKFEGKTRYEVVQDQDNSVLRAVATQSASGLAAEVQIKPVRGTRLEWRWKIENLPENASERNIKQFDHTARLFVVFKTSFGPPRTINYAWSSTEPVGEVFHHPRSGRSRFLVVDSGIGKAGQWTSQVRDLAADWEKLFGDKEIPEVVAVGLMTDSDGTKTKLIAYYDDIRIVQGPTDK